VNGGTGYYLPPLVEIKGGYKPGEGRKARASAVCSGGSVTSIVIEDGGSGYFETPTVRFVPISEAILQCVVRDGSISSVKVISGGYGYASPPRIVFRGGSDATATAIVANGSITSVVVVNGGSGFSSAAKALVDSGVGVNASASATISASVSRVTVLSCGEGFEPSEPVSVFFSGGGSNGRGASVSASIGFSGSGASATGTASTSEIRILCEPSSSTAGIYGVGILDIIDYASTSKYKTTRAIAGVDSNSSITSDTAIGLFSGLWQSTAAINSITITAFGGSGIGNSSSFALYGIN
jgi:hypothetical protein